MTRRGLFRNVLAVCLLLAALVALAVVSAEFHKVLKDFGAFFLAIAAAYLGYCFQRRQAFLATLRDLWHACIEAKADIVDYTHLDQANAEKWAKAQRSISVAIDKVRAVYRNVGETEERIGYFPFEPLHDIRRQLERLGPQETTEPAREDCRDAVIASWNAFRWAFLREFAAPDPTHPIVSRDKRDPRRERDGAG